MINKLEIQNFQSHKNTILEFSDGVNVIIGESDKGKTAILRSLLWSIYNRPLGDSFINYDSDECKVIVTKNDDVLKRIKNKSGNNEYEINKKKFSTVGVNVPDEVNSFFNLLDVNIQRQHDPHFLISQSSGEISRFLNKLINIDIIDSFLKQVDSDKRSKKAELNIRITDKNKTEKELNKFENVGIIEKKINALSEVEKELLDKSTRISELSKLIEKINYAEDSVNKINELLKIENKIIKTDKIETIILDNKKKSNKLNYLVKEYENKLNIIIKSDKYIDKVNLIDDVIKLEENIISFTERLNKIKSYYNNYSDFSKKIKLFDEIIKIESKINIAIKYDERIEKFDSKLIILDKKINNYTECLKTLESVKNKLSVLESKLNDDFPDICPLCGKSKR